MKKRVVVLARKSYGAFEMKEFIGKATLRSFAVTMSLLALIPTVFIAVQASVTPSTGGVQLPTTTVILPPPVLPTDPLPPPTIVAPPKVEGISKGIDGSVFVPVNTDVSEQIEIGSTDGISPQISSLASSDPGINSGSAPTLGSGVPSQPTDIDDFQIEVEQEPVLNYNQLRQNLHYPELARRSGTEGSVLLRVVVGVDGKPVAGKIRVVESTNELFNQAAIDAILRSTFTPAIQNKQPIEVPVMIPITFHLH
jgi:protein TonB